MTGKAYSTLDELADEQIAELAKEVMVDGPEGEESLDTIMTDIAAGHNEIQQYKLGALALSKRLEERAKEERNKPGRGGADCPRCDAIEAVQESAMALYLRIERGDAELTGREDGKHSGRFSTDE